MLSLFDLALKKREITYLVPSLKFQKVNIDKILIDFICKYFLLYFFKIHFFDGRVNFNAKRRRDKM
jgi:hypothetical protein